MDFVFRDVISNQIIGLLSRKIYLIMIIGKEEIRKRI